jgi:excinuclease ABC subunit A
MLPNDPPTLALRGVRVHNLQNIDVDIPRGRTTVLTGISGAGKSSLAFDTLYAEAQRRYLQSFSAHTRQYLERFEKPDAEWIGDLPLAIAVSQRTSLHNARATVGSLTEIGDYLRLLLARTGSVFCPECGTPVRAHTPQDIVAAAQALPAEMRLTVAFPSRPESPADSANWAAALQQEGFIRVQMGGQVYRLGEQELPKLGPQDPLWVHVDRLEVGKVALDRLSDSVETAFARGQGRLALLTEREEMVFDRRLRCPRCDRDFPLPQPRLFDCNDPLGACSDCEGTGTTGKEAQPCATCGGRRYGANALAVRLAEKTIADLGDMSLDALAAWAHELRLPPQKQAESGLLLDQVRRRLAHLTALDLAYLTLDRGADTLSSGELRRVRLTAALASNLVGALYVVDEPSVGLHPRDTAALLTELGRLKDTGNTLVLIEHDRDIIAAADHVIDLGPGAGEEGGRVVYQGPPSGLARAAEGPTSDFWSGRCQITLPAKRRRPSGQLRLSGARTHNLQDLTVEFPLGVLCVVTGVSGAGKSSLVEKTLYPALCLAKKKKSDRAVTATLQGTGQVEDAILMDQEPLPRTSRSNPATYLKIFDDIRALYAETSDARIRNFGPGHFSFNQAGGRCETCEGQGMLTVAMQFLPDASAPCPECLGRRYKKEVLEIKVRSLSIAEVLELTVREAFRFFRAQPAIERRLKFLLDVGLDYLRLGQPADTLSGGECQRLKLAGHLAASRKARTLFLLLEPSAGLHAADVARLLDCFDRLLEAGHSLLVVEHHLDVIKCADYVIDLGPGAGAAGGCVVAAGTPEEVAQVAASATGQWLGRVLPSKPKRAKTGKADG